MIRRGIYKPGQLNRGALEDIFGKEKNISLYLYQKLNQVDNVLGKATYAETILNRFNSDRNVIKRTYKNRFNNFDHESIVCILKQNFESISILDLAISDGSASCYFLEQSTKYLKNFSYTGSDLQINYYLNKKDSNGKSYIITDGNNKIIEITRPPFVWNLARKEGNLYFINNMLKCFFLKKAQRELLNNKFKYREKIELIHPDFKNLLVQSKHFQIRNYNLFDGIKEKYAVIRAMNILHYGYFNEEQVTRILNNLYSGLNSNGLLIEGSNEDAGTPVEGAIYKKTETGFSLLQVPEKSSRINDLVLSFIPNY